jgi:hypothetical protein
MTGGLKGPMSRGIGATLGYWEFGDFSDWLREPVFWYGIVAPVALLVIVTLYLFWLDRKAGKLYRLEANGNARRRRRKPPRKKFR